MAGPGSSLLSLALSAAFPRFIAPLFNRFTPLEGSLRERVDALLPAAASGPTGCS